MGMGGLFVPDRPVTARPFRKAFVSHLTTEYASLGLSASSSMSAVLVGEHTPQINILKESLEIPIQKGVKPVRLERMLGSLNRYPDWEMTALIEEGFCSGFKILSPVSFCGSVRGYLCSAQ